MNVYATHGHTESGDALPIVLWDSKPKDEEVQAKYAELLPGEEGLEVHFNSEPTALPQDIENDLKVYSCLVAGGVDNWDGYDWSLEELG